MLVATGLVSLCGFDCAGAPGLPNSFTRLKQLPAPKIVASAEAYPGGNYNVGNIIDGKTQDRILLERQRHRHLHRIRLRRADQRGGFPPPGPQ